MEPRLIILLLQDHVWNIMPVPRAALVRVRKGPLFEDRRHGCTAISPMEHHVRQGQAGGPRRE